MRNILLSLALLSVASAPALAQNKKDGKWQGSAEASFTIINSNRSSQNFLLVGNAKSLRELDRILLDGYYNFGKQTNNNNIFETSTDQWSFGGRYERDFGDKSFYYASGRFEADNVNNLNLRTIGGAGVGYTIIDNPSTTFRISSGLSYVNEEFSNGTNAFWGFQAQSEYSRELNEKTSLDHIFLIIPNFDDINDYYFKSNFGLSYKLNESMSAGLRYIVNYTNKPANGSLKQSTTYAFVLGYKF